VPPPPLPQQPPLQQQQHHRHQQPATLAALLAQPDVLIFLFRAAVTGAGLGVIGAFLFIFVGRMGGGAALFGLMLAVK
jgi:hypothetical protein